MEKTETLTAVAAKTVKKNIRRNGLIFILFMFSSLFLSDISKILEVIVPFKINIQNRPFNHFVKGEPMERRIPSWIRMKVPGGKNYTSLRQATVFLHTVCIEARCPNIGECACAGHAAFLVLGTVCTRHCGYCAVSHGTPQKPDQDEPEKIAAVSLELKLSHIVLTSVTRDDLPDGGAFHFAACVSAISRCNPQCGIELLVPDFRNKNGALEIVFCSRPDIINHNIETTRGVFRELRPQGDYDYSLSVIRRIADAGFPAKSGLMIGFGESMDDIERTLHDLRSAGCSIITVGQYLQSHKEGFPVAKFYTPDEFHLISEKAKSIGFPEVLAGPMVRSSYHAGRGAGQIG